MPTIPGLQLVDSLVLSNLASGLQQTVSTDDRDVDDDPVADNKLYTNPAVSWEPTDSIDSDWTGEIQVVLDQADVATTGDTYKTFDINIGAQVSYALDSEINTPSWLSTWENSGRDHIVGNDTLSLFVKDFAPGTVTIGGHSGTSSDSMGVVMVKPGYSRQPNVATTGSIEFDSASYSGDDGGQTITFFVNRVSGTVGAASVVISISTDTSPGSTLNTASASWSAGDATQQSGTVTTPALSADDILTLGLGTFVGASEGNQSTTNIFISDTGDPPTASDYFVNTSTGDDNLDGTSATVDGGGVGPWKTIAKANATAITDSKVSVATATFTNDPIIPTNKTEWIPTGGDVTLKGPSSGSINYGIDLAVAGTKVLRDSSNQFIIDGDATKVQGSIPTGNIRNGARITADNCVLECRQQETVGYRGTDVTADNVIVRMESLQHGTTDKNGTGFPFGNTMVIRAPTGPTLIDGEGCNPMIAGGHGLIQVNTGTGLVRHMHIDNDWEDVGSPFVADEGWRGAAFVSTSSFSGDDCIFEHGGQDVIGPTDASTGARFGGGGDETVCRCFFLNGKENGLDVDPDGSNGHRFSHLLFYNNQEAHIRIGENGPGVWTKGAKFYNIIFGNNPLIGNAGQNDVLIKFIAPLTDAQEDLFEFAYNLVPADAYVYFRATRMTLAQAEIDFPAVFHDNIVGSPDWVSAPSAPTFSNVYTGFATNVGSPARNAGKQLTTITSTGSGTAMPVADAGWFPHPRSFVSPTVGPANGGYQVNHQGTLKTYTAVSNTVVTLSASSSWTIGDNVSLPYTSSDPDIGPVQS